MKKTIRLLNTLAVVLSLSSLFGCADFPNEYAFDATIEISQESIKLADDNKNYEQVLVFDFKINDCTFDNINEAYIVVNDEKTDVIDQINPQSGGKVVITNRSSDYYGTTKVRAFLKVADHVVTQEKEIWVNTESLLVLETSKASNITVFSATVSGLANNSSLVKTDNIYILLHDKPIDFKVGDQTPENKYGYWVDPQVLKCVREGNEYKAEIQGLGPDEVYYYQVVRLLYNTSAKTYSVTYSAPPKQFTSATSTAKVDAEASPGMFEATVRANVDPGNTADVKINASDKITELYAGVDPENLSYIGTFTGNSLVIHSLNPATKYFYKVDYCCKQRPGNYVRVIKSSGVKSFTTEATTATIMSNVDETNDFGVTISGSLNEGNIPSFITQHQYYCSLQFLYGKSPDNLKYSAAWESGSTNGLFTYKPSTLDPNTTYYYKIVCAVTQKYGVYANESYYSNNVVTTGVKTFSTSNNSITETRTLPDWTSTIQNSTDTSTKSYSIYAKEGSILAFDYTNDFSDYYYDFTVGLSGVANVTMNHGSNTKDRYCNQGRCFYKFTKTGNYTLKLTFKGRYYNGAIKNIKVTNIKVYDVN